MNSAPACTSSTIHRYAGVVEGSEVEPNHLAKERPFRLPVLEGHQEAPVPRGEAPREAPEIGIDLGQVQHLEHAACRSDSIKTSAGSSSGTPVDARQKKILSNQRERAESMPDTAALPNSVLRGRFVFRGFDVCCGVRIPEPFCKQKRKPRNRQYPLHRNALNVLESTLSCGLAYSKLLPRTHAWTQREGIHSRTRAPVPPTLKSRRGPPGPACRNMPSVTCPPAAA